MANSPTFHPVYKSLNKPLTIWGSERRLFFLALITGAAVFNFFGSFWCGLALFSLLLFLARRATAYDPQALRILLNSTRFRVRYDPWRTPPAQEALR
jgi:type IV secretory pathway TrbD component